MKLPIDELLDRGDRTAKPRARGLTIVLDTGVGLRDIEDLAGTAAPYCDYAKIAWGSSLITANIEDKLEAYARAGIKPLFGGTLFEYCYLRGRAERLLDYARETGLHIEISDGVIDLPRQEKLRWIEKLAKSGEVFSELGAKGDAQSLDWKKEVSEELAAGATKVVIEGRQLGPVGREIRTELVDELVANFDTEHLVFEALERYQQVWLIKNLGRNVNLGNIRINELLTLESFRLGLKEHTLLHFAQRGEATS